MQEQESWTDQPCPPTPGLFAVLEPALAPPAMAAGVTERWWATGALQAFENRGL